MCLKQIVIYLMLHYCSMRFECALIMFDYFDNVGYDDSMQCVEIFDLIALLKCSLIVGLTMEVL